VALVDNDPAKVGKRVGSLSIEPVAAIEQIVRREEVAIGIICTPASAAQEVAERMVASGIRSILNFAPAVIVVPEHVSVRKVDLAIELQILGYYEQRKAALAAVKGGRAALDLAAVR
jgi:redox-sensing transcriptional repressor